MAYPSLPLQTGLVSLKTLPLLLVLARLGLSLVEAIALSAHSVVFGVALLAVGLAGFLTALLASPIILGLFAFVFGTLALYGYRELDIHDGKGEGEMSDSDTLTGRMGRVTERITPTSGEVKLDEGGFNPYYTAWSVHDELEAGTEVIVVDPDGGSVVTVEGIGPGEDGIDREFAHEWTRQYEESAEQDEGGFEREGMEGV